MITNVEALILANVNRLVNRLVNWPKIEGSLGPFSVIQRGTSANSSMGRVKWRHGLIGSSATLLPIDLMALIGERVEWGGERVSHVYRHSTVYTP